MGRLSTTYQVQCNQAKAIRQSQPADDSVLRVKKKDAKHGPWELQYTGREKGKTRRESALEGHWSRWKGYHNERAMRDAYGIYRRKYSFYGWRIVDPNGVVLEMQKLTENQRYQMRHGLHPDCVVK